jgi:hypothetical protein
MKYSLTCLILLFLTTGFNAKNSKVETKTQEEDEKTVPFTKIDLSNLDAFKPVSKNWKVVGDVNVDRSKKGKFNSKKGTGVLLNRTDKKNRGHLFTNFEHGDMELELDVMMPVGSNSGLYFQGRYEIQLLDSWGVDNPQYSDIGGIYQRGGAPRVNAAKAPGLWQHFKIVFQAPTFDSSGAKVKNALFKEVWLNGALLHRDKEVSDPTTSAAFSDEQAKGALMIQGDHGAVAFRNIKYKLLTEDKEISENKDTKDTRYILSSNGETVIQRAFIEFNGKKRTHGISVATPYKTNYTIDLEMGSLLQIWNGDFLDAKNMWDARGEGKHGQVSAPLGSPIHINSTPDFAFLSNEDETWPKDFSSGTTFKQLSYELDENGTPVFTHQIKNTLITSKLVSSEGLRALKRTITVKQGKGLWHKIGEGSVIEKMPDGTFAIDDKSYYVDFLGSKSLNPIIRSIDGKYELIVKVEKEFTYSIIW